MAKKRGNGEGSIVKRKNGMYMAQASCGRNPETGRIKRKSFYGKTRKGATEKLNKFLNEQQAGTYIEPTNITLGDWITRWMEKYKKPNVKPTTYEGYEITIRTHIIPSLGEIPLSKLCASLLQNFYNEKLNKGRAKDGSSLSAQYVRHMHIIIRGALQQAVTEGLIIKNTADATKPPKVKGNQEMNILTENQLSTFIDYARLERLGTAFVLDINAGLRRGELLGLTWNCINLESGSITVKQQLLAVNGGILFEETTKSKAGNRNIPLTQNVVKELKRHRAKQEMEKRMFEISFRELANKEKRNLKAEEIFNYHNLYFAMKMAPL